MQTVYAIGARLAGGGIGTTAYHAARGVWQAGALRRLLVSSYRPCDIPPSLIRSLGIVGRAMKRAAILDSAGRIDAWSNALFDRWASRQVTDCDIFHGWGNMSLYSLRRAGAMGAITIVERASSHPREQMRLLEETHARYGLPWGRNTRSLARAEMEFEETDYVTIPSDFVRRSFLDRGFDATKLIQIPFGVDVERFRPAEPSEANANRPFRVLFVGQVTLRKGVLDLLEAWRLLKWPDAELWLVGRVDPTIQPLLAPYTPLKGVRFVGHVPDPVTLFQSVDLFAFPSIEEGSALVTYEAMACGLPLIVTPNAGSVARHEEEALLVPPADAPALVEALARLRDDPPLRTALGNAARTRAEAHTWELYGQRLVAAYAAALKKQGQAGGA